ncbi:hypothetical protein EYR40_003542 [Pleurotus pulmonarius]|nr:hypothetical protein EYR40_003542 [Pleurotus pulmonarius]KAF4606260.1 hypothetical protein EYR38_000312 [Pleurotus pulmonarius]
MVCKIDQQPRGTGTHNNKSVAKDEASKRALEVLDPRLVRTATSDLHMTSTGIFSGIYIFQPLLSAEKAKSQNGAEAKPSIVAPQDDASVAHKSMTSES